MTSRLEYLRWNKDLLVAVRATRFASLGGDAGPEFLTVRVPLRFVWKDRGKYYPHQGLKERARRLGIEYPYRDGE